MRPSPLTPPLWIPACAGMTLGVRGNDRECAGMTVVSQRSHQGSERTHILSLPVHTPLASLAPLSPCERGVLSPAR